ncbi:MAG: hypothetical protein FJW26_08940 [Acidimicrobiia bacterium]|nr:hypothetical protein [Acidimicrobiia bacterium]
MERVPQFKLDGDLSLTVPLTQGFDKILHDFVLLTAERSGFASQESSRMAIRISSLMQERIGIFHGNGHPAQLQLTLTHHPGRLTITTTIAALNFSRQEHFQCKQDD